MSDSPKPQHEITGDDVPPVAPPVTTDDEPQTPPEKPANPEQ